MNSKNHLVHLLPCLFILTACSHKSNESKPAQVISATPNVITSQSSDELSNEVGKSDEHIKMCQRELDILKRIDNAHYTSRKIVFDKLMSGARLYGDVRKDLQPGARSTVDALFSYKIEKLCADISQDVLNSLSKIGESSTR